MAENQALIDNRYTKAGGNNPPPASRHKKHPNGYLTPILKKLLEKKMTVKDPEVKKLFEIKPGMKKAELKKIIMLRYILNAVEGENPAIEGILDRMDGKLKSNGQVLIDQSTHLHYEGLNDQEVVREALKRGYTLPDEVRRYFRAISQ